MDFNYIYTWCLNHWQLILTCLLSLINIIICLCKHKVKLVDSYLTAVLSNLPGWINDAEVQFGAGNGDKKLKYVLDVALHYLVDVTGYSESKVVRGYGSIISGYIESILATPTSNKEVSKK